MMSSIGAERDAVPGEKLGVALDVLADLEDRRVLEHRREQRERGLRRHLALGARELAEEVVGRADDVAERQVGRLAGPGGEREADQLGAHLVERGRSRASIATTPRFVDPARASPASAAASRSTT